MRTIQEEMKRLTDLHEGEFLSDSGSIEFLKVHQLARIADALEKMVNCRNETALGLPNPRDAVFGTGPMLEQVSEMTTEQYEKNRDRILAQLKRDRILAQLKAEETL